MARLNNLVEQGLSTAYISVCQLISLIYTKNKVRNQKRLVLVLVIILAIAIYFYRQRPAPAPAASDFNRNPAQLVFSKHARCRMDCRKIDESEVREILQLGTINAQKSEPAGRPDPKYALEGRTHDGQDVRIVFAAPSATKLVVVTVIDLDTDWTCHCE